MADFRIKYIDRPPDVSLGSPESDGPLPIIYSSSRENERSPAVALINALLLTNKVKLPSFGDYDLTSAELEGMFATYIEERVNHALENGNFDLLTQVSELSESGAVRKLVRNDQMQNDDGKADGSWPCMQADYYAGVSPLFQIEGLDLPIPLNGGLAPTSSIRRDDDADEDLLADLTAGKTVEDLNAEFKRLTSEILDATDTDIAEELRELNEIIEAIGAAVGEEDEEYRQLLGRRNDLRAKARESARANVDEDTERRAELLGILRSNALPLTKLGHRHIVQSMQDGDVTVAAFGGQYVTLMQRDQELYSLVTDATQSKSSVVWERLEGIYGKRAAFDSAFQRTLPDKPLKSLLSDSLQRTKAFLVPYAYAAANNEDVADTTLSDLELARRLQLEEDERERERQRALERAAATMSSGGVDVEMEIDREESKSNKGKGGILPPESGLSSWNLELIVSLEVRNKYYFLKKQYTDELDGENEEINELDWEQYNRGANCVRAIPSEVESTGTLKGMQFLFSDAKVLFIYNICTQIMLRHEYSIPRKMVDCAKAIVTEPNQELHREEEQAHLISMLQRGNVAGLPNLAKEARKTSEMYNENARSADLIGNARTGEGFVLSSFGLDLNMIYLLKNYALKQNVDSLYLLGLVATYRADLPRLGRFLFNIGANQLKCKWCLFESSFFGPMEYSKEAELDVCNSIQKTMPVSKFVSNIKRLQGKHQGEYAEGAHRTPRILRKLSPGIEKNKSDKRFCSNKYCGRWSWQRTESTDRMLAEREAFDKDYEDREVPSTICKALEAVVDDIALRYDAKYVNDPVRVEDFQLCSGCESVAYCSQACQYVDWYLGRHKKKCKHQIKQKKRIYTVD